MLIGLIPARSGSKGIPGKNLMLCGGKPLLAWTAEAARASGVLDRVILSTDDEKIAEAGRPFGLEVPACAGLVLSSWASVRPSVAAPACVPPEGIQQHFKEYLRFGMSGSIQWGNLVRRTPKYFRQAAPWRATTA